MSTERTAFLTALAADEDDTTTRLVYADWLDEHDEPEEADRMRKWPAAKAWMLGFVKVINYETYVTGADGEPLRAVGDDGVPLTGKWGDPVYVVDEASPGGPHTYADAIEAGRSAARGDEFCFGSDAGADYFRDGGEKYHEFGSTGVGRREEFFRNWSILTGVRVPGAVVSRPPFRCAC